MKFVPLLLLICAPLFAAENGSLQTADGTKFKTWIAGPKDAERAIVLVHDWFGFSPFLQQTADRFAAQGARVIAVDLYDGENATTHQGAWRLMEQLDPQLAAAKIDAAIVSLDGQAEDLAVIGFSMGSVHALWAAIRNPDAVDAAVVFYGDTVNNQEHLTRLRGPVLAIYGSKDGPAAKKAAAFSEATDAAGALAEIYVYPGAHHAFAQPLFNQGATYDAVATEAAFTVAKDFLDRRLGSSDG